MLSRISWWLNKFLWGPLIRLAYGRSCRGGWYHVKTFLVWQKIFRINGSVPWFVHPSSRVTHWDRIKMKKKCHPGMSIGNYIQAGNGIELGESPLMGPNVGLISANHDRENPSRWLPAPPIRIGDHVWIGMNAVVLPGVSIGDKAAIGAGAVVNVDVPPGVLAVGNPCRIIPRASSSST